MKAFAAFVLGLVFFEDRYLPILPQTAMCFGFVLIYPSRLYDLMAYVPRCVFSVVGYLLSAANRSRLRIRPVIMRDIMRAVLICLSAAPLLSFARI